MVRAILAGALALALAACASAPTKREAWPPTTASDPADQHGWTSPRLPIVGPDHQPLVYHRQRGFFMDA